MKKVAVIGAGVMGCDVAIDLAFYGYEVILKDISPKALDNAKGIIEKNFRFFKMMKSDYKSVEVSNILEKITFTSTYSEFKSVDYIVENINENLESKLALYAELDKVCSENVLYFVNTSCISITNIASAVRNCKNVIGMHFMNPVPLKELVEVVRGFHTSEDTIGVAKEFVKSLKKQSVVVNDYPGFVANRLSHLFMNEAAFLIQENVAKPNEVDLIFKKGYGHKLGPLETADLIGLDTVVNSLDILYQSYQDPKFRCCPLLKKMVNAGLLGRKSGKGFYEYS
ncbi:MAG: 3-hydroxyacyl-CoA dehydrogenase family protein [Bacteroidales bacterium]|nr:3-hydroxyacyl-CoA dehydrogenase family protein [Bacteroidales bacterium]